MHAAKWTSPLSHSFVLPHPSPLSCCHFLQVLWPLELKSLDYKRYYFYFKSLCGYVELALATAWFLQAYGRPPRAQFCLRFPHVTREFLLATVTKCLPMGEMLGLCEVQQTSSR